MVKTRLEDSALPKVVAELNHLEAAKVSGATRSYIGVYITQDI